MKSRLLLFFCTAFVLCALDAPSARAQKLEKQDPNQIPRALLPDLITDGISYTELSSGKIQVAIRNVGQKASVKSLVRILVTMPGTDTPMGYSADVRGLNPGQMLWVPISTNKPLRLAKYCAIADVLNQNKESNEENNKRCGEFEGKP